jgi:FkbM family methyltransferase
MTKFSILNRLDSSLQLLAREEITTKEKFFLLLNFYKILLFRKFIDKNIFNFMGYKIKYISRANFEGIFEEIFIKGDYFIKLNNKNPVIIDCGGNIGLSTIFFKKYYPESTITTFEPSKDVFSVLKENIELNGLKNINLINSAVSDKKCKIILYKNERSPGSSTINDINNFSHNDDKYTQEEVESVQLSDYINQDIDLLKIDIEGSEGVVLKELDSKNKLEKIKDIVFEFHFNQDNYHNSLSEIIKILEKNNFKVIMFNNDFGLSSEFLKHRKNYHIMIRATKTNI